mmetsp:Transcript_51905/g.58841  ORF Transcript_51905/g.58841 Transcript_51905/m.58841 type:complete len:80 (-) Transcript_51905:198-437(-)
MFGRTTKNNFLDTVLERSHQEVLPTCMDDQVVAVLLVITQRFVVFSMNPLYTTITTKMWLENLQTREVALCTHSTFTTT